MSEELIQKGLTKKGLTIGNYEFYNIGNTTINQLKKYKVIPNKQYKGYEKNKPDALLIDRRNKNNIKILLVVEYKDTGKFKSRKDKKGTIEQCNTLCQILQADIGIATDNSSFIWFNPKQPNKKNEYVDSADKKRSYTIIQDKDTNDFIEKFIIDQTKDEIETNKLNSQTRISLEHLELVRKNISVNNSKITKEKTIDPTRLAKQIWQDVWSVSGATPEKCLYTFVELFIFKYLSDLDILDEDDKGNKINFRDIYKLTPEKAFKNYSSNAREHLKIMFPVNPLDNTTIINGTVLNPDVPEHSNVFYKILKKFNDFGKLENIDPKFKSKVFEEFMKESISKKNWGRYFTPRNIVDAMIEISDIDKLAKESIICDPACGVGGFILEPMKVKDDGVKFYYRIEGDKIKSRYDFYGFDKGFEKEEQLTIILAKANMLIFLSDLLKKNPTMALSFSELFNKTFTLLSKTILGTLNITESDKYDLILTNPPYVTSGSSNYKEAIKRDSRLSDFYKKNAMGVEGLFLEWIIRSLKPSRKAFVIIPDGLLNRTHEKEIRQFILDECILDGIISLPINAFYTTPKKTYILCITKKSGENEIERKKIKQTEPVFTYLVSNIGETLDVKRFSIPDENDLIEAVSLFNQFKGAKTSFKTKSLRCKIQPIEKFTKDINKHWSVDRWWKRKEKIKLGIESEDVVMELHEFQDKMRDATKKIKEATKNLDQLKGKLVKPGLEKRIVLSNTDYFETFIGKRVLKEDVFRSSGKIPVYSANVFEEFGYLDKSNISNFDHDYVLWGIDGEFEFNVMKKGTKFATTDHCGVIKILDENIVPEYLLYQLELERHILGYDRTLRPSLKNMNNVEVKFPINRNGKINKKIQEKIIKKYILLKEIKNNLQNEIDDLLDITVEF
ncbi:MAG: N-6 DNA methylase [Candidatus Aenigmarchaeota archaeon]|nr:N-6 DNA methylase [Candidatus Aenigmarchaeota archaeon]